MASKKIVVVVPKDKEIEIGLDAQGNSIKQKWTFRRHFLIYSVLNTQQYWGKDLQHVYTAGVLRGAFEDAEEGAEVELSPDHHKRLKDYFENPPVPLPVGALMQCPEYLDAIVDAKPRKDAEKE